MKGHVRERGAGNWYAVLEGRDPSGKRRRRWVSLPDAKGRRQAQLACARLIAEQQHGTAVDPNRMTVSQYIDRFLEDWCPLHLTQGSVRRYGEVLAHARRHLGDHRLQALRPADISGLCAVLIRQGLGSRTIKLVHSVLLRALKQAKLWGLLHANPAELVRPPKVTNRETDILQSDRARELLDRLRGRPLYMIASLALNTGMRRNEMLALRWSDVDTNAGRLQVEQALEGNSSRIKGPKTKHGRRTISLPASTVTELKAHRRAQQERRLAIGAGRVPPDGYVFADVAGNPLGPNALTQAWPVALRSIGMPAVTLHSLRHTHASLLIAAGTDVLTISRRLGHASPTITLSIYGHLIAGSDDKAASVIEAVFGKGIG